MRRAHGLAEAGFSLIESLASLVIVAMIGLMLIAGLTTGRRVWERIDVHEADGETVEAAQSTLRDRIDEIYPETRFDTVPSTVDFTGGPDNLVFLANPADVGRPAPLRRYQLYLNAAGQLVLSSISDVGPAETAAVDKQILLTGVRQMDVAYFGAAAPDGRRQWRRLWQGQPELPETVRIRLDFQPGDARHWPELIVRPRTTIDSACLIDLTTHGCKGRA